MVCGSTSTACGTSFQALIQACAACASVGMSGGAAVAGALRIAGDMQRGGETVKAWVVLKPGQQATEAELKEFCTKELAPYKVPRWIEFRAELPKTATGKIQRFKLRAEGQL